MTMTEKPDPYSSKPRTTSDPGDWHELSFQLSVDASVDWANVDLRKWSHTVAKYTALMLAESAHTDEELESFGTLKTLIMGVKVDRVHFINDESLHSMIDEFGEENDGHS